MTKAVQERTKVQEICDQLRAMAYEKGPGAQLPTVRALCKDFGTTRVTLGEALDQLESEQLLVRKDRQGIFVAPDIHYKHILVLFDASMFSGKSFSLFWSNLWVRLEQESHRRTLVHPERYSFHIIHRATPTQPILPFDIMRLLDSNRCGGVLGIGLDLHLEQWLRARGIPCVTFAAPGKWLVVLDGMEMARLAVHSLYEQGCRSIGIWLRNDSRTLDETAEYRGYIQTLEALHLPRTPELVRQPMRLPSRPDDMSSLAAQEGGYQLAKESFGPYGGPRPDGIFIGDEMMTDGMLVAFDELGIVVGRDVQIVTHANVGSPILFGRTRYMTVYEYDSEAVVHAMFTMFDMVRANLRPNDDAILIPPQLRHHAQPR